jgi:hypothetical protein
MDTPPKVPDLDLAVDTDQQVLWLDVTVDDPFGMEIP